MTDVGASKLVVEGKIKLKNDSVVKRYTKTGFEFEDGSTVDADVILFATGCVSIYLRLYMCPASPLSPSFPPSPSLPLSLSCLPIQLCELY